MNYVELVQHQAEAVFGNKAKAEAWLTQPKTAFNGRSPIEFACSETGYILVKETLEKIDQGHVS